MKKLIVSFLFVCLVLLKTQAFALKNDRDIFGVFVETESKVERKKESRICPETARKAIRY